MASRLASPQPRTAERPAYEATYAQLRRELLTDAIGPGERLREVELAERFCNVVPCAERVHFLKTGAEAMSAAVRLARTYTGRDLVIGSGYFGWHDWCSSSPGVPEGVRRDFRAVPFDDIPALESAARDAGNRLAAIVVEPVVEHLASPEWIARARALA